MPAAVVMAARSAANSAGVCGWLIQVIQSAGGSTGRNSSVVVIDHAAYLLGE